MANRQIYQLTSKTIASTDVIPLQDTAGAAEAKKVTVQNIIDAVPSDSSKLSVSTFNTYTGDTQTEIATKADKAITVRSVTGATSLLEADNGKAIECDGTFTLTFPNGLSAGWQVLITNVGAGTITLAATTTLQTKDSNVLLASQYGGATAYHRGSNVFLATGDLT